MTARPVMEPVRAGVGLVELGPEGAFAGELAERAGEHRADRRIASGSEGGDQLALEGRGGGAGGGLDDGGKCLGHRSAESKQALGGGEA